MSLESPRRSLEQQKQVMELLNAALDLPSGDRVAFLDKACGEASTLEEVKLLLKSAEKDSGFMEEPAFNVHAEDPDAGRLIGPYRLVRLLGRGGMGAVHLAVRADDFEKRVALKLIKRGMDTDEIVRRFHNERKILAQLEHPYIARLLDGGTTMEGLPWFAMDYVEGEPIHRYCDTRQLSVRERLELFRKVCSAVRFAHQHLVVHRDLKPDNILVTADGEPRLLDFGIAKLLGTDASLRTVVTAPDHRPMTPAFASPEQIRGEPVTTAADVYGLGLLLYQLLSGHSPYGSLRRTDEELARWICEKDPNKPSAAVRSSAEIGRSDGSVVRLTPELVSRRRGCDPGRLRRDLSGDLDAIVLKTMRKKPQHRYGSVEQLSKDLHRYLTGRPVEARAGNFVYRVTIRRTRSSASAPPAVGPWASDLWGRGFRIRPGVIELRCP